MEWFVCGIPEHGLLIFTKNSDIKTKDGQQLKYHGSVKPRGEWTPLMKQAFEQVRATVVTDVFTRIVAIDLLVTD